MTAVLLLAALLLVLALLATGLRRVPAQRVATVRRFGRYHRTLGPGWHWLTPLERKGASHRAAQPPPARRAAATARPSCTTRSSIRKKPARRSSAWTTFVAEEAREAAGARTTSEFKLELNRRVAPKGLPRGALRAARRLT
jgi:hypothetical protein